MKHALLFFLVIAGTNTLFSQKPSHFDLGFFKIHESGKVDIGFSSFGFNYTPVDRPKVKYHAGLQFIGATTGVRGGFFAFGFSNELQLAPFQKGNLRLNLGASFLAGGGANAPDKDGWIIQGKSTLQYRLCQSLFVYGGAAYSYISGGIIQGWTPTLGVKFNIQSNKIGSSYPKPTLYWHSYFLESGVALSQGKKLGFIGAGAGWQLGKNLGGDASIHALANTHGGYMQFLASIGPSLKYKRFQFLPGITAGLGGGGNVKVKGGSLGGVFFMTRYHAEKFNVGLKYQYIDALETPFSYQGVFVSVGKTIRSDSSSNFVFHPVFKTYMGDEGFGNIGARFQILKWRKVQFMGSTYWACTDKMGAYAEGLFEVAVHLPKKIPVYFLGSLGAGAGAHINSKTESIISGISLGLKFPKENFPLAIEGGLWNLGKINYYSLSLSYKIGR